MVLQDLTPLFCAAHGTADLGGHAHAVAGQQHAFHGLAIRQLHQQSGRAILAGVFGMHTRQTPQFIEQARQLIANGQRQKVLGAPPLGVERAPLNPRPQHAPLMAGRGAEIA